MQLQLSHEQLELQSLVEYFYAIDGVPANGVKFKGLRHVKVFIQSTSQGSRCLKKGENLLYLEEVNYTLSFHNNNYSLVPKPFPDSHTERH
jgi:hypothetical protein